MTLTRNIIWNVLGTVAPILVGIVTVPLTVHGLGTERFGFLSVIWLLIGYFSIFDLGLGRTLTQLAASHLARGEEPQIAPLAWTSLIFITGLSTLAGLALALSSGYLAGHLLAASSAGFQSEASAAIVWIALSLPFVLLTTALMGLLEGYQQFALTNLMRAPMGILMLVAPLAVLPFTRDLGVIAGALAGVRVLNAALVGCLTRRAVPALQGAPVFRPRLLRPLLAFGGWLTVSNVISPALTYFDRFFIAGSLGAAAVAYYTVPYDVLNRVLVLPGAIQNVLFPTFAQLHVHHRSRAAQVFERSSVATLLLMIVPLVATLLLANQGLTLWVGPAFATHGALVAKILMAGVLVNAMARTPFVFVQGAGHAKWTALLHVIELPMYVLALWWLLKVDGIVGAAWAWTARVSIDCAALYAMSLWIEPRLRDMALRDLFLVTGSCGAAVCLDLSVGNLAVRVVLLAAVALLCGTALVTRLGWVGPLLLRRST